MEKLPFRELPLGVKVAVGVSFFTAWMCIEEFVIDRYGIWKYMPYYRRADACVWDLTVGLIIVFAVWRASRAKTVRST